MTEDKKLELQMIAASNTSNYCKENNIVEFEYEADSNMEIYTQLAQTYFNAQILNFKTWIPYVMYFEGPKLFGVVSTTLLSN